MSPSGTDQQSRRPSRSPRNQRSRSADVDCLKKYIERRVEMRRHTEAGETSRWIPLSKSPLRVCIPTKDNSNASANVPANAKSNVAAVSREGKDYHTPGIEKTTPRRRASDDPEAHESNRVKWHPILKHNSNYKVTNEDEVENERTAIRQSAGRSLSADVTYLRRDSASRWNERYVNFADRGKLVSKWTPESGIPASTSRCVPSPLPRRTSEGDKPKINAPGNAKWPTFARHPLPSPYQRKLSDRYSIETKRSSIAEVIHEDSDQMCTDESEEKEFVGWQPVRKFVPSPNDEHQKACAQGDQEKTTEDINSVKQRLRELYDFKIETECPQRVRKPSHESLWISNSISEEDKFCQNPESPSSPVRRNSQDLEFNDHNNPKTNEYVPQSTLPRCRRLPELPTTRRDSGNDQIFEPYSTITSVNLPRVAHRRTFSDDYENPNRRKHSIVLRDTKWNSISATRSNYIETEPLRPITGDVRSIDYKNRGPSLLFDTKRLSTESNSCNDKIEVSHRRSMSHYDPKSRTPQPQPEIENLYKDFRAPKCTDGSIDRGSSLHLRRNSTWYNPYNT